MKMALSGVTGPCRFWMLLLLLELRDVSSGHVVYSVSEEARRGTVVGNVAKDLNIGVKDLESRSFQIVSGTSKKYFAVNLQTGALFVDERIDREEICGSSSKCAVKLEALVQHPHSLYRMQINILDINDNSPKFPINILMLNITEIASPGERFPLPQAKDIDVGVHSLKSYMLSSSDDFTLDVQKEGDQIVSVDLVLQKHLDREKQAVKELQLTAVDGGKPSRSGTLNIIIHVLDVNDNNPVFSKTLYKIQVNENVSVGTKVLTVSALDVDEGVNSHVSYSLIVHGDATDNQLFSITPETGDIVVMGEIDYEENPAIELRVRAQDKGSPPRSTQSKVLVEVVDVNDNAPGVTVTPLLHMVREDSKAGTAVALVTVSDKDGGKNGEVRCSLRDSSPFKLEPSYENYYSLMVSGPLDREKESHYNITILAVDEGTPALSAASVFTLSISDVNDNAPRFPEQQITVYLKENSPVGSRVARTVAHDPDLKENAQLSYSLLDTSSSNNPPVSAIMTIDSVSGEIYSAQTFNYEEVKQLSFVVQATDSGVPPLSSNVTVNVFILDENDNSPVVLPPYSEHGSVNAENIPYSAEAGYFVAKIRAVDGDSGYNALLSYHISEPKSTNLFRIGSSTGEVRTKRRMSDNDLRSHPLVIVVCDHGEPPLSATVSIDVVVSEMIDDAETTFRQAPVQEKNFSDLNLYLLVAIIAVSLLFLLSLISLLAVKCYKAAGSFSKYSTPVITSHPDGTWSYSKSTQQYDVCFSSDTLKSDVVVLPPSFPPFEPELVSLDGTNTFNQTQTLPNTSKPKAPNADWRYSASLRAGVQSSVHMEESSVMQGAQGMLVQNWPTVSSAADGEGGELSPPSWRRNQQQQLALPLRASTRLRPPSGPEARGDSPRSLHYPRFPCHHFHSPRARHW
uniref:Cadherin domain-containing protein n=1 Tax=Denticeps clupeoides TaxID=299321 RepID=A0AAY4BDK4_9TELE